MRFSTPALRSDTKMSASSRRVWATQMRCAMGFSVLVCSMPETKSNGALARLRTAPVRDRDERGLQWLQLYECPRERRQLLVVLRRKEFEGVGGALGKEVRVRVTTVHPPCVSPCFRRGRNHLRV